MKKIEDKIVNNLESIKDDITGKFGILWELNDSFEKHTKRRINLEHIKDKNDYIL